MITDEQYSKALFQVEEGNRIITAYQRQASDSADDRWKQWLGGTVFTDDELTYTARHRCRCGAGLAHPKGENSQRTWFCSAVLKGLQPRSRDHDEYPFRFYLIRCENHECACGVSTRPA